ncbi:MAG TPA: hypothetical protein VGC30_14385 [Dokdonella sp.]
MTLPRIPADDEVDLPDEARERAEGAEGAPDDDWGDETQEDEQLETEQGLEQDHFIEADDE